VTSSIELETHNNVNSEPNQRQANSGIVTKFVAYGSALVNYEWFISSAAPWIR
jgi:hypothetical protein